MTSCSNEIYLIIKDTDAVKKILQDIILTYSNYFKFNDRTKSNEALDFNNLGDLIRAVYTLPSSPNSPKEIFEIEDKEGFYKFSSDYDCFYAWFESMEQITELIAPYLANGSYIDLYDWDSNTTESYKVKNNELVYDQYLENSELVNDNKYMER